MNKAEVAEDNFNKKDIETTRALIKIEKFIAMIKKESGYGLIVLNVFDSKIKNVKATISKDL